MRKIHRKYHSPTEKWGFWLPGEGSKKTRKKANKMHSPTAQKGEKWGIRDRRVNGGVGYIANSLENSKATTKVTQKKTTNR